MIRVLGRYSNPDGDRNDGWTKLPFVEGRFVGPDAYIENHGVGDVPLLERSPVLEYVPG